MIWSIVPWLSASGSPRSDWTRKTMTSAVEYPGVVTTSNCAEGGSHSLSAGIFVTVAVYRIAGRPEMVKFVGRCKRCWRECRSWRRRLRSVEVFSRAVVCHDSPSGCIPRCIARSVSALSLSQDKSIGIPGGEKSQSSWRAKTGRLSRCYCRCLSKDLGRNGRGEKGCCHDG